MSMASDYLTMKESKSDKTTGLRFKAMIEELDRKPLQVRADLAVAVLDTLFDHMVSTETSVSMLTEFEEVAKKMIMPETTDNETVNTTVH